MSTSSSLRTDSFGCPSPGEPEADSADDAGEASGIGLVCWARSWRALGRRGRGSCFSARRPRFRPCPLPRWRFRPGSDLSDSGWRFRPGSDLSDQISLCLRPRDCFQQFHGPGESRECREGDRAGEPLLNLRPSKWHWHLFMPRPARIDRDPILGEGRKRREKKR